MLIQPPAIEGFKSPVYDFEFNIPNLLSERGVVASQIDEEPVLCQLCSKDDEECNCTIDDAFRADLLARFDKRKEVLVNG